MTRKNNVSLRDIYELSEKMDAKLDKACIRITSLEIWKANATGKIVGMTAVLGFIWSTAVGYIMSRLKK